MVKLVEVRGEFNSKRRSHWQFFLVRYVCCGVLMLGIYILHILIYDKNLKRELFLLCYTVDNFCMKMNNYPLRPRSSPKCNRSRVYRFLYRKMVQFVLNFAGHLHGQTHRP